MKNLHLVVYSLLVFTACSTNAGDSESIPCEIDPASIEANFPTHLTDVQREAIAVAPNLCKHALLITDDDKAEFSQSLRAFTNLAKDGVLATFPEADFTGMQRVADTWEQQVNQYAARMDYLNFIDLFEDPSVPPGNDKFKVRLAPHHRVDLTFASNDVTAACRRVPGAESCGQAAKSLQNAVNPVFQPFKVMLTGANEQKLSTLQRNWNDFIEESRYQTPLDVWFTTYMQRDDFSGKDLVGPPSAQLFLLRPTIVFEYVDDLDRGDRDDISLAIEWAGINWWQKGFGVSLTSVYNDREDAKALGHGLTLHIKSKYSLGFVHRSDGNNSVFFNIDLLEWFGESKAKYHKYREYF